MAFAGLWEIWRDPAVADDDDPDAWVRSCVDRHHAAPTTLLEPIHSRMPVMLDERDWDTWLDPATGDVDALEAMLRPAPDDWLEVYPGEHARELARQQRRRAGAAGRTRHAALVSRVMETQQYLEQLAQNSERLADAAGAAGVDAPVPSCPGWTVTDLLQHCVGGDAWARTIVEQGKAGSTDRVARGEADPSLQGDALVEAFREGAHALVAALSSVGSDTPVWTFSSSDRTAAFWQRRRSQETAVHRYDAELAAGTPSPLDATLAVDGIDEILTVFLPRLVENFDAMGDGTVHLHCTDVDGEWLLTRRDGEVTVTAEHAKGDVAARGTRVRTCCCSCGAACPPTPSRCSATPTCSRGSVRRSGSEPARSSGRGRGSSRAPSRLVP